MSRIDFELRLHRLFSIQLKHDYYDNKKCRALSLVPTLETERVLRNNYLTFKPIDIDGFLGGIIFYDPVRSILALENLQLLKSRLSFFLINNNPLLFNLSDIPFFNKGRLLYFNNLEYHSIQEEGTYLHVEPRLTSSSCQLIQETEKVFQYVLEPVKGKKSKNSSLGLKADKISVVNAAGEEARRDKEGRFHYGGENQTPPDLEPMMAHRIDLSQASDGFYQLKPNSKDFAPHALYARSEWPSNCLGIIDLFLMSPEKNKGIVQQNGKNKPPELKPEHFVIHFAARKTYWRYYIIGDSNPTPQENSLTYAGHEIANVAKAGEKINFSKPTDVFLKDKPLQRGTPATRLISTETIAFREFSPNRLELQVKRNGSGRKLTKKLPLPSPKTIKASAEIEQGAYYADIYVYL